MEGRSAAILVICFFIVFLYDLIFRKYSIQPPIHGNGLFAKQTFLARGCNLSDLFLTNTTKLTGYVPDFENALFMTVYQSLL